MYIYMLKSTRIYENRLKSTETYTKLPKSTKFAISKNNLT